MITIDVKDYCHNCPNFDPVMEKVDASYTDMTAVFPEPILRHNTIIFCTKRAECERMYNYICSQRKKKGEGK